jgi:tRNA dimethylallyltransferase
MATSSRRAPARSDVVAIYGPTASGKTAVAGALLDRLDAEVVSADSAALYEGLPILTAAPPYPARLVGVVSPARNVSVGEYERLAHAAVDEVLAAGRVPVVVGGTGLYLRAALTDLALPPPPAPGVREHWEELYDTEGGDAAHAQLADRDPRAAARVHANDRRRVVRALELADTGASLAPADDRLWTEDTRRPTLLVAIDVPLAELDRRIEARTRAMADAGTPCVDASALRDGTEGDGARGVRDARARGRCRGGRGGDAPARALPAQVAPQAAGRGYPRRHPPTGGARR